MGRSSGPTEPLLGSRSASIYYSSPNAGSTEQGDAESGKVPHVIDRSVERDTVPETATYGRNLSWTSAYLLTVSRVVGSGIFASPGIIYREVGSPGLALLVWLIGAAVAVCGLVVSMELGCMLPRSGGHKVYLEFMYRRPRFLASTLVAVQAMFLQFTAAGCVVFSEYLLFALGYQSGTILQRSLAVGLITVITIIHGCFLKPGIWIQDLLAWIKIGLMAFMAVVGLVAPFLPRQASLRSGSNLFSWSQLMRGSIWSWSSLSTAVLQANFSFSGADNLVYVLNEVKKPVKTLKTAAPLALLTITLFYLMVNIAFFTIVPLEEFEQGGELVGVLFFEKLFGASVGGKVLPVLVAISAAGAVMSSAFAHVCFSVATRMRPSSNRVTFLGKNQSRDRPSRVLPVLQVSFFISTVQRSALWVDGQLYPYSTRDHTSSPKGSLFLHTQRCVLSRPSGCPFPVSRPSLAAKVSTRPEKTVQGLEICCCAETCDQCLFDCGAIHSAQRSKRSSSLGKCHVRFSGWRNVRIASERKYLTVANMHRILCGVLYWYMWTVVIPRWGNYSLEEETAVLKDGTSITRLVKVHAE